MFFVLAFLYILGSIHAAPTIHLIPRDASTLPSFADASACICPPHQRAVTDIVWSCLATIFVCAWVAVHPNIPAPEVKTVPRVPRPSLTADFEPIVAPWLVEQLEVQDTPQSTGWDHQVLSNLHPKSISRAMNTAGGRTLGCLKGLGRVIAAKWHRALPRLELMAWTIIAPEFMIFWAMRQWKGARETVFIWWDDKFKKHNTPIADLYPGWTKTHGYFLQMGGFVLYEADTKIRILDSHYLAYLLGNKKIEDIKLTKEDIEDRSKGDALSKTIVLGQTTWFIAQCISRSAQNLATTELELITLAFAALNGFMYFFWWDKPLDVSTPIRVYLKTDLQPQEPTRVFHQLEISKNPEARNAETTSVPLHHWPVKAMKAIQQRLFSMCVFETWNASALISSVDTHVHIFYAEDLSYKNAEQMQAIASLIAVLFGAIHCVGWNFAFPSTAESILWQVSALIVTTAPLLMEVRFLLYDTESLVHGHYKLPKLQKAVWSFTVYIALPLYFLARIILILEAILTLRHLSPSALTTVQWSSFLPHI